MQNTHEYLLQGSIVDTAVETLIQRVKGLADPKMETFKEQEMVFSLKGSTGNILLHSRCPVSSLGALPTFHIRYVGNPEPDMGLTPMPVVCRKVVDTLAKSDDMMNFYRSIGLRYEYGFLAEGFAFTKGFLKIVISKISKLENPSELQSAQKLTNSHLVELSVLAPPGEMAVAKTIRDFADQLKPLVQLEKIDYTHFTAQSFAQDSATSAK